MSSKRNGKDRRYSLVERVEIALLLQSADIIEHSPVTLRGGEASNYYIDVKKAFGQPKILGKIALGITEQIPTNATCLAASGYGGLPLATAVSLETGLPITFVRDNEKSHGRGGRIDGYVPHGDDIYALLDDVFTSGNSLRSTVNGLRTTSAQIKSCHVVVARSDTTQFELPVTHIVTADEII